METNLVLDLFAGVGGLSFGFEMVKDGNARNRFILHRAVEIDQYACETLRQRHSKDKVIQGDLTKKEVHRKIVEECRNKVSIIVGGIPCQSFSLIGPRSGFGKKMDKFKNDRRDFLYQEFKEIVCEIKPKVLVLENVKGILSKRDNKGQKIIHQIISDFENVGYSFENENGEKYFLLNAADYGVPQKRERVVLIGVKKDWKNIKIPMIEPTHYDTNSQVNSTAQEKRLLPYVSFGEAVGDLPKVKPKITYTGLSETKKEEIKRRNKKINSGIDKLEINKKNFSDYLSSISQSGKKYFQHVRPNGYKFIDHHIARSQQVTDIQLFNLMNPGETAKDFLERMPKQAGKLIKYNMDSFMDKYRRQGWSEPATTIFAHLEKDGN